MALFSGWSPLVSSPGLFSPRYGGLNVSELGGDVNGDEEDPSPAFTSPGEAIVIGTNEGDVITIVGEVVMETTDVDDELPSSEPPSRNLWVIWCCFMLPCREKVSVKFSPKQQANLVKVKFADLCRSLTFVVKPLPQTSHLNGRSLVWLLMWISSAELQANTLKQI